MRRHHKFSLFTVLGILFCLWVLEAPLWATWISHKVKLPVFIERISLGISETDLYQFKIANPWRYKTRNAFKAKTAKISYQLSQLRTDPVVFEEIAMDQVYLVVEFPSADSLNNNWTVIGKRILKGVNRNSKGVQIQQFVLTNVTVEIIGHPDLAGTRKIDRIELENIDSEQGFPTHSLVAQVFQESGLEEFLGTVFYPEEQLLKIPFKLFLGPK